MGLMAKLFGGKSAARLDELLAGRPTVRREDVLGLGVKSRGAAQARGNGWLALTADELIFVQWMPVREFRAPLGPGTQAGVVRSWLGKSMARDFLHIAAPHDEAAFVVRDLDGWLAALGAPPRA